MNTTHTTHTTAVLRIARKHRKSIKSPGATLRRSILGAGIAALLLLPARPALAGSDTWKAIPGTGDWNTATNWVGGSVPNGAADVATFATSTITSISVNDQVRGITFNVGASAFTITAPNGLTALTLSGLGAGVGITNNSGITQNFVANVDGIGNHGAIRFVTDATAGSLTAFTNIGGAASGTPGGLTSFQNNTTAGSGTFTNNAATVSGATGGYLQFFNSSTASTGTFTNKGGVVSGAGGGGLVQFLDTSTAASGTFNNNGGTVSGAGGGITQFQGGTAATGTFTNNGGTASGAGGGVTQFSNTATAGSGTFITNGAAVSGANGGNVQFLNTSTAGGGTFTNNGATVSGAFGGGLTQFFNTSTAATGTFTNKGGTASGAGGGITQFQGGTAATGTFTNNGGTASGAGGGVTQFTNTSTAGSGTFITNGAATSGANGGNVQFLNTSTAGSGTFTNNAGTVSGALEGEINFFNTSTAGNGTFTNNGSAVSGGIGGRTEITDTANAGSGTFTNNGGTVSGAGGGFTQFYSPSAIGAGTGTFINNGGTASGGLGGSTQFYNTSTAGSGHFTNNAGTASGGNGGKTIFNNGSTAGTGTFTNNGITISGAQGGETDFKNTSSAGSGTFTTNGATISGNNSANTEFFDTSTAASGNFTTNGGTVSGATGGFTEFNNSATAANGTFTVNGGTANGAKGGVLDFLNTSTAGNATLIANGFGAGAGAGIFFYNDSTGGTARVILALNGNLDISPHNAPGVTVGSIEGNGKVFLGARNLTVGSNNQSHDFSGVISDAGGVTAGTGGSLTKIGTGTQTLSGINTYTGDTNVNGGVLSVNGSIASPNVFVNAGGTLGGIGTIGGNVSNSGIVSPGNSPGTLTVTGNYLQNAAGLLQIEIAGRSAGQFDVLAVGGTASLNGTLKIITLGGFVPVTTDKFTILTAAGGRSGTFASVDQTLSAVKFDVKYLSNSVLLEFVQTQFTSFFAAVGNLSGLSLTPNQRAVAGAIDSASRDPRSSSVINFLLSENIGKLPNDFDLIGPEELTSIFHIAVSLAKIQDINILRRLEEIRREAGGDASGSTAGGVGDSGGAHGPTGHHSKEIRPPNDERWGMWFTGSGEFTRVGSTTNAAGFNLDSGGVTAGVDYRFTDHFAAGISLGYMNTTASLANGGKIDVDGGRVGAYATYFDRGLHVDASVSGGPNSYKTRRTTPNNTTATGGPEGTEVNLLFAAGYDWKWKGVTLGPVASFQYTNMQLDGFTESGAFAPLSVIKKNAESARTALGMHATFDAKVGRAILRPEVRASWQHEFGDTSYSLTSTFATLGGSPFTVSGPATGRDSLLVGAGFSIQWSPRFSTYAYYDGELLRQNYSSHNISAGCRFRF